MIPLITKALMFGGEGDNYIGNEGDNVPIYMGDGDDTISNWWADNVTIATGAGNDYIYNDHVSNVLVKVKGGNKIIKGAAVINLSSGNNTVMGDSETQVYQYTCGNNVITDYSHEDSIEIMSGKIDSYSFDDKDLIFHIGDGSLTLKNMINHAITVKDSVGETMTQIYGTGYSGQQVIKNLVQAWNKTFFSTYAPDEITLDESIKLCSHFNGIQDVIDKMVADCRATNDADKFLREYCGIILDNADTGAITGLMLFPKLFRH